MMISGADNCSRVPCRGLAKVGSYLMNIIWNVKKMIVSRPVRLKFNRYMECEAKKYCIQADIQSIYGMGKNRLHPGRSTTGKKMDD